MVNSSSLLTLPKRNEAHFDARHFLVPAQHIKTSYTFNARAICAIIPTYAPSEMTVRLVRDLARWNTGISIIIVDDGTPEAHESTRLLDEIRALGESVTVLRTPINKLKAGALNCALEHIFAMSEMPEVVLTLDDDVVIAPRTVRNLVGELMSVASLGAVCSQCRVYNKNKNLLTRLQGLEYLGFNAIRLADEGFYRGPLVMHGMLTAFRLEALRDVRGYTEGHLIEDYDITTRLKEKGWSVGTAQSAPAWTLVPENLYRFWRQRTRWSYGGITVVAGAKRPLAVFQDLLGHATFLATLGMVGALFFLKGDGDVPPYIAAWIIVLSLIQLGLWYAFQLWLMLRYEEADMYDWLIRIALLPEYVYSYVMTFALIGSYIFHSFNIFARGRTSLLADSGRKFFRRLGYAERAWGTRRLTHTV